MPKQPEKQTKNFRMTETAHKMITGYQEKNGLRNVSIAIVDAVKKAKILEKMNQ